jgi:hypothetical protein
LTLQSNGPRGDRQQKTRVAVLIIMMVVFGNYK